MACPRAASAATLLGLVLAIAWTGAVAAQAPSPALRIELAPLAITPSEGLRIDRADLTSVAPLVWVALSPAERFFERLGLFAGSREISDRRQPAHYDVEGGALLRVNPVVSLTGGYRVTGYQVEPLQPEARDGNDAGPFVALRWHF